jgi:hypothetical protein
LAFARHARARGGEKSYDGATWFFGQFSQAVGQLNNALNNGWLPGR